MQMKTLMGGDGNEGFSPSAVTTHLSQSTQEPIPLTHLVEPDILYNVQDRADFHTHPTHPCPMACLLLTRLNFPSLENLLNVTETIRSDCRYQDFPLTFKSNSEFHRVTSLPAKSHQLNKVKFSCNKSAVNSYYRQER